MQLTYHVREAGEGTLLTSPLMCHRSHLVVTYLTLSDHPILIHRAREMTVFLKAFGLECVRSLIWSFPLFSMDTKVSGANLRPRSYLVTHTSLQ